MARYKNGIQRVSRRQTQNFEDDSSFMMDLSSLHENNIALAKALAKQKEIQKQIRNMETTNNILRSKSRMCAALVREDVSVMTEVIRELSSFLNNILLVITDMRRQTEKCETILRMVDNDNPDVSGSGVMSRTQLVNPMVKGHTLKKATIHLKRLDLSNLNLSLNEVVDVDDAPQTPPAPSEASDLTEEIMSEDEMPPERDTRPPSPAVSDLTEEITSEDEMPPERDTRPPNPAVSEDNLEVGVVQVEDRDENQTLLQDENMLTNQPMSEDSTLIDVSIQNKYPRQSLQMVRRPIVTLERLDMFPGPSTSSNSSSSWVELGEPPGPGQVMNGSDREHGQDVHSVAGSRVTNKKTSSPLGVDFGGRDQSLEMRQSSSEKSASPQSRNRRKKSPPLSSPSGHRNCRVLDKKKTSEKKVLSNSSSSPGNSRGQKRKSSSPVSLRTSEKLLSGDRSFPSRERSVRRGRKKKVVGQVSENGKSSECLQTSEKKGVRVSSSGSSNKVHKKKSSFSTNRVSENGGVSGGRLLCRDVITIKDEDSSSLRTAVSGRGRRKKTSSSVEVSNNVQRVEKVEATASIDIPDDSLAGSESDRNRTTTPVLVEFVDHIVLSDDNMDMLPLSILTNYCQAQKKRKSTGPMNGTDGVSEVIKSNVVPPIDLNVRVKDERNHRAESLPLAQVAQTSQSSAGTPLFFVESPVYSSNSDHRERTPPSHVTREFGMHQETHRPDESPPGSLAFRNLTRPIITYQNRRKTAVVKDLRESLSLNSRTVEELPRRDAELTLPLVSSEKASSGAEESPSNPNLIQRLQEQMSSSVKSLDRVNSFLKPAVVSAVAAVNSTPSREAEEEDPLEGPSWLYDSQDTRSSLKKRKLLSSDPTFIIYSSGDSSDESPAVVKKKKRTVKRGRPRLICNLKKSPASIESHVDAKEVRRSLRCQRSRKTK